MYTNEFENLPGKTTQRKKIMKNHGLGSSYRIMACNNSCQRLL